MVSDILGDEALPLLLGMVGTTCRGVDCTENSAGVNSASAQTVIAVNGTGSLSRMCSPLHMILRAFSRALTWPAMAPANRQERQLRLSLTRRG
jgi:hypothetical protein